MHCQLIIVASSFLLLFAAGCTPDKPTASNASRAVQAFRHKSSVVSSTDRDINPETTILSTIYDLAVREQQGSQQLHTFPGNILFTENGRNVAYIQSYGDRERVVFNGRPGKEYADISHLEISPDGRRLSFRCKTAGKEQLINDGVPSLLYDNARDQLFSPDSRHLAYLAKTGGRMKLVLDEKVIQEGEDYYHGLRFNRNSNKFVFNIGADDGRQGRLVIVDLMTGARTIIECLPTELAFNKITDTMAIAIADGDKQRVLVVPINSPEKRQASGLYNVITNLKLGSDGKSVTFVDVRGEQRYLVVNNKEYKLPDNLATVSPPVFQPDLKGAGIVLATRERHGYKSIFYESSHGFGSRQQWFKQILEPTYGKANIPAYVVNQDGNYFMVIGGKKGPEFDKIINPMFSPDGTKLIYRARTEDRRFIVVVDVATNQHQRQSEYDMVFEPTFTADGKSVAYGVKQGTQLIWKVEKL